MSTSDQNAITVAQLITLADETPRITMQDFLYRQIRTIDENGLLSITFTLNGGLDWMRTYEVVRNGKTVWTADALFSDAYDKNGTIVPLSYNPRKNNKTDWNESKALHAVSAGFRKIEMDAMIVRTEVAEESAIETRKRENAALRASEAELAAKNAKIEAENAELRAEVAKLKAAQAKQSSK